MEAKYLQTFLSVNLINHKFQISDESNIRKYTKLILIKSEYI